MDEQKDIEKKETEKDEKDLKKKSLKISIYEGSAHAVSEGFGMRYIPPFALAMGASNTIIGFLASLPSLFGNFSQLFTHKLMLKYPRKKIAFFGALSQAIMWLAVIAVGFLFFILHVNSIISPILLVIFYSLLITFGAFYSPSWNSWMRDIVPEKSGGYFGIRNRICGVIVLVSLLIAGFLLDFLKGYNLFFAFAVIFSIAFIFRTISAILFLKKYEPEFKVQQDCYFSFWQFIKNMKKNNFGRFVLYISIFHLAVAIASPFFAVYMLKNLGFSYMQYMLVTISSTFAVLLFIPFWGKFSDKFGHINILRITGFLIPLVPILWLLFNKVYWLVAIEFFSGFAWAGYNFTMSNFVYDAVTKQRMAICVAYLNFLNAIGIFIGATLGGVLSSYNIGFLGMVPLLVIFLLSGVLRMIVSLFFIPKLKEVKPVEPLQFNHVAKKMKDLKIRDLWNILEIRKFRF